MKILHLTNSLNPAYGGPAACIRALAPALAAIGHASEIVALDAPGADFLAGYPATVHALGPVKSGFGYSARFEPWLKAQAARFDAVIVHGLWQHPGVAALRQLTAPGMPPYFVFTHGMLDPWFKRQYPLKHYLKIGYWMLFERRVLREAAAVLFTCEEERRLARPTFPAAAYRERVVTFGTTAPPPEPEAQRDALFQAHPELRHRPYWLFLGRIHLKKGVDLLIDAYSTIAAGDASLPRLVIAGPCDDPDYLARLQASAAASCPPYSVLWPGMLTGAVKWGALRVAEAFVLPSHQENFGIAAAEALACGTPVLLSNQVNIHREIAEDGAGLVEPDTADGTLALLRRWRGLNPEARRAMRAAAMRTFGNRYEIGAVARSLATALGEKRLS